MSLGFPSSKQFDEIASSLSIMISLLSKEASQEIVLSGLPQLFAKYAKSLPELEQRLANVFATVSTMSKYSKASTNVSIRLQLGSDAKMSHSIINAYKKFTRVTPMPRIGLIIDYDKGKIADVSEAAAEIISLGGKVTFAKGQMSSCGITNHFTKNVGPLSIALQSVSINLPRLAFESNKDETYFRARLALLMKPALASMASRRKNISDLTRRGPKSHSCKEHSVHAKKFCVSCSKPSRPQGGGIQHLGISEQQGGSYNPSQGY